MSFAPHAVEAMPAPVGQGLHDWPHARSPDGQVKGWQLRFVALVAGQRVPLAQVPQLCTVRLAPQRSVKVRLPQAVLRAAQISASVSGVQPQ